MHDSRKYDAILWLVVLIACLVLSSMANAEGDRVREACTISWTAPQSGPTPDGYRVFVGTTATLKTQRAEVTGLSVACQAITPPPAAGQNYVHVVAFNVNGAGPASVTVPFDVVVGVPGIPGNVRVQSP